MWDLDNGLRIVRALQPVTRKYGYHLALGGGVLNKGESKKDLDLYFLPMGSDKPRPDELLECLTAVWGVSEPLSNADYSDSYENLSSAYKHAVKFERMAGPNKNIAQRIDCFIF
jgi:hypothetical protein